jgi:hypothetical protein
MAPAKPTTGHQPSPKSRPGGSRIRSTPGSHPNWARQMVPLRRSRRKASQPGAIGSQKVASRNTSTPGGARRHRSDGTGLHRGDEGNLQRGGEVVDQAEQIAFERADPLGAGDGRRQGEQGPTNDDAQDIARMPADREGRHPPRHGLRLAARSFACRRRPALGHRAHGDTTILAGPSTAASGRPRRTRTGSLRPSRARSSPVGEAHRCRRGYGGRGARLHAATVRTGRVNARPVQGQGFVLTTGDRALAKP